MPLVLSIQLSYYTKTYIFLKFEKDPVSEMWAKIDLLATKYCKISGLLY